MQETNSPVALESDAEISLLDIVNFLQGAWKKLVIAAIVGATLGLVGWLYSSL